MANGSKDGPRSPVVEPARDPAHDRTDPVPANWEPAGAVPAGKPEIDGPRGLGEVMGATVGTMVEAAAGAAVENESGAERRKDDDASDALMASTSLRPRRSAGEADAGRRGESSAPRRSSGMESRGETNTW